MDVLGYSPKLKKDQGLAFGAYFLHESVLYLILYRQSVHVTFFLSQDI